MTYCVGVLVREGLVMIADTRTNAGLDNIATFRKLHAFDVPGDRAISLCTAGNLATTQAVMNILSEGLEDPESGRRDTMMNTPTMFKAAHLVGRAVKEAHRLDGREPGEDPTFDVSILLGGQIAGGRMQLFMVYSAGNFMEATTDTPFLQIGEHKYGKPILDRAVTNATGVYDALKIGLISMDSTVRSNLGVGLPIDVTVIRRDALAFDLVYRIVQDEPYFHDLRERWSAALRAAHQAIPPPPYKTQRPA